MKSEDVSKVLNDVQDMKGRQDEMTVKLDQIKRFVLQDINWPNGRLTKKEREFIFAGVKLFALKDILQDHTQIRRLI